MKMTTVRIFAFTFLLPFSLNAFAEGKIYKCQNQKGVLQYQNSPCQNDAETVGFWETKERKPVLAEPETKPEEKKPSPVLTLKQTNGHYFTDATVDGKGINFVIDTGASYISLPATAAHEAQIYCDEQLNMQTANGVADACTAKIKKFQFGPFVVEDVQAAIVPNLDQALLGMNVLQLFKVQQEKGEMRISIMDQASPEKRKQEP